MTLPSKGWGPWRQEFYSLHSNPSAIEADTAHAFGTWNNAWATAVSGAIYDRWPKLWRKWANLPFNKRRTLRRLQKFFPNLVSYEDMRNESSERNRTQ